MPPTIPSREEILAKIRTAINYLQRDDLTPDEELIRSERVRALRKGLARINKDLMEHGYNTGVNFSDVASDDDMDIDE